MSEHPIPEEHRRKALYAALYHHDGVGSAGPPGPTDREGAPIIVDLPPEGHPDHDEGAREYVKTVGGALGFSMSSRGPMEVVLRPDVEHAIAGLR